MVRPAFSEVAVTSPTTPASVTTGMPARTPWAWPRSSSTERNHGETSWPTTSIGSMGVSNSSRISAMRFRRSLATSASRNCRFSSRRAASWARSASFSARRSRSATYRLQVSRT